MPNETEDYNNFVRANLPAGMSYSANRYRYNNHSFYVFELAAWYYYYLLRVNSPSNLFSANEVGVWYDPSDLTTLFQDSAGTTPVTAPNQPVGLMLDKSKGLALGAELVSNGDFSNGTTGWYLAPSSGGSETPSLGVVTNGALVVTGASTPRVSSGTAATSNVTFVVGKTYKITAQISGATSTPFLAVAGAADMTSILQQESPSNAARQAQLIWTATSAGAYVGIRSSVAGTFTVDNISVREIAGKHATQATAAQRPTYGIHPYSGLRNFANGSASIQDVTYWGPLAVVAGVTVATVARGIDTDGLPYVDWQVTGTATASTGTSIYAIQNSRIPAVAGRQLTSSFSLKLVGGVAAPAGSGIRSSILGETAVFGFTEFYGSAISTPAVETMVSVTATLSNAATVISRAAPEVVIINGATYNYTVRIKGFQFENGSTRTAYQANFSQYNITEAGVPSVHYIGFDGVDDGMVTSAITPATDKVQVFAGVRKFGTSAAGLIAELSADVGSNNGAFGLAGPANTNPTYFWASRGLSSHAVIPAGFPAPISNVLTGLGDISADLSALRVNGTQVAENTGDQGTSNYLAYPLYIGRRGGVSIPFNGNLYSLIVRFGSNLTTGQITNTETWVNQKTGAY